jgi:competence protein ComEC
VADWDAAESEEPVVRAGLSRAARWALDELLAEKERWPLWLPAFLGAGVGVYFALKIEPPLWLGPAILAAALAAILASRESGSRAAALALGFLALGFSAAEWRAAQVAAPSLDHRLGPVTVSGRVVEVERRANGTRVTLDGLAVQGLGAERTPRRVRIRLGSGSGDPAPGDRLEVTAVLLPPGAPVAPGAFDFQRHAFFLGLGAVGYAYGHGEIMRATPSGPRLWLASLRDHIAARVVAGLPGSAGGIAAALMTGERGAIPLDVVEAMRNSGLAHLLAIAGLHLGMVTGALFFGLRALLALVPPLALRYPIKKWAAGAALVGAFCYLCITGATVPTERAFIMAGVVLLGIILDRVAISMRLVAWAAAAILLIQPESLLGPSFQMSFGAVVALVAAYEALRMRLIGWRGEGWWRLPARYLVGIAFTSLITGFATIPYSLFHFDRLAAYGVVANLIAVPVTALWVMPWAIICYALMPFGLETVALRPMGWGLDAVIASAKMVSGWPGSVAILPAMPVWGLVLISLGGLWLCLWQRPWRWGGLAAIAMGLATIWLVPRPDVIVSGDGKLFAVVTADGSLLVSPGRGSEFDADTLLRQAGQTQHLTWPDQEPSADGRLRCDELGCIYRAKGQVVALAREREALADDCREATVVVSALPLRHGCPSASVAIDRFDLWRRGGHAFWLGPDEVRVETVADWRGQRPWVPAEPSSRERSAARLSPQSKTAPAPVEPESEPDQAPEDAP